MSLKRIAMQILGSVIIVVTGLKILATYPCAGHTISVKLEGFVVIVRTIAPSTRNAMAACVQVTIEIAPSTDEALVTAFIGSP